VSRKLVEAMGGIIGAVTGAGSNFWIELDRGEVAIEEPQRDDDPLIALRAYAGGERRLLYVEDTLDNVQVIEGVLGRASG
jgi:hypothetical protein